MDTLHQSTSTSGWRCVRYLRIACVIAHVVLLLVGGMVCAPANATMKCEVSGFANVLAAGSVSVPANSAAGETLKTLAPTAFQSVCTIQNDTPTFSDTVTLTLATTTQPASGYTDVYPTNVAGIGVRYTFSSSQCGINNLVSTNGTAVLSCAVSGSAGQVVTSNYTVSAKLVSTGAVAAGSTTLNTAPTMTTTLSQASTGANKWSKTSLYTGSATGTVVQVTCSVSQPNVSVALPNVSTGALSSEVGSIAGSQPFSLSFSCAAGTKVWITITDNVNPANRSNALQPTTDSTAQGIGVQVLSGGSPVSFGADSAVAGNANQWLIGDSPNGPLQVPLTARYVSTGKLAAGTVKALATFTMSYQ